MDLAAARVPGLDHCTVTSTQENVWVAWMQDSAHHLELVFQFRYLLPCIQEEIKERKYQCLFLKF